MLLQIGTVVWRAARLGVDLLKHAWGRHVLIVGVIHLIQRSYQWPVEASSEP